MSADRKGRLRLFIRDHFPRVAAFGGYFRKRKKRSLAVFVTLAHIVGALTSVQAIMSTRTAQGAVAWAVSLNTLPYVAVPAYWVFGRSKFEGYVAQRRGDQDKSSKLVEDFTAKAKRKGILAPGYGEDQDRLLERLAKAPATVGNDVQLLRNSGAIFPSIFEGIDQATQYILVQFYTVRDDDLGRQLRDHLKKAAARGVRIYFVYDEIGSSDLPDSYVDDLRSASIQMIAFNTRKGITNHFQLNFRNHRKTVIADGRVAWVGGANIGDEYNGGEEELSPWHDTMIKITGPAVLPIQVSFCEDWLWASENSLNLEWTPLAADSGVSKSVICIPSGPADPIETCTLYYLQLINSARERLWIASPYFVPDEQIVTALELAALRGVDVRILLPDKSDNPLVDLSSWAFIERLEKVGAGVYRHTDGFMHQKVTLVDSDYATVGSANLDNRSFRLNFELTMEVRDPAFAAEVETMLENDFLHSRKALGAELESKGFWFQLKVRAAYLLSPIQ